MNSGGHQEGGKFDFLYGCSNLSFAVSICNYWLIRIEFFVQRDLFQTAIYPSVRFPSSSSTRTVRSEKHSRNCLPLSLLVSVCS